jgi:hypothetical protein
MHGIGGAAASAARLSLKLLPLLLLVPVCPKTHHASSATRTTSATLVSEWQYIELVDTAAKYTTILIA